MNASTTVISAVIFALATGNVFADPPAGAPKPLPPLGVFCIQPLVVQDTSAGDTMIVFEMVNWTPALAISLDLSLLVTQSGPGITMVGASFTAANDWTTATVTGPSGVVYSQGGGTPIPNNNLGGPPFLNPFAPAAPDSGPNTRRGFGLVVNDWGPSERLAIQWDMGLLGGVTDPDSFDSGVWQLDRSSDPISPGGFPRITQWEQPFPSPTNGFGAPNFQPLDVAATDANAVSAIPEPSPFALLGLIGVAAMLIQRWRQVQ